MDPERKEEGLGTGRPTDYLYEEEQWKKIVHASRVEPVTRWKEKSNE